MEYKGNLQEGIDQSNGNKIPCMVACDGGNEICHPWFPMFVSQS